jgi:hypothetical protein
MAWILLLFIESAAAAPALVQVTPLKAPDVAALYVIPLMLLEFILMATVTAPELLIIFVVPLVALVALLVSVLLFMLTVAAEAEFTIPVKVPDVAVV